MKIKKIITPPRIFVYWVLVYVWALLFMGLFRLLFLLRHWHLTKGLPAGDLLSSFFYGAKFDMVVVGYILSPFILISYLPYIGFEFSKITQRVAQVVMYALFALTFMLSLIDIEYYGFFGDHLGVWLWSYFDSLGPVLYSIIMLYPVIPYMLGWIVLTAAFIFVARKFNRVLENKKSAGFVNYLLYFAVTTVFFIISIRGGLSLAPIDWGTAYHSNYYFANELSLNGIYTLARNIYEYNDDTGRHNPEKYQFFTERDALGKVQDALVSPKDSLIEPGISLKRSTDFPLYNGVPQNVVIIVLESWSAKYVGACGGEPSATPFFDELSSKSLFLKNFYAAGLRTNRGLLSVLCSFPSLPGRTVMKLYGSSHPFLSIADILKERNYNSYFIYGGDLDFDNMGGFFRMQGFENFIGIDDFDYNDRLNKWGVPDHIVLERANKVFADQYPEPFIGVMVTLSNHEPFVLPDKKYEKFDKSQPHHNYLNTFYYSDCSLRHFFDLASREDYFNNTIFVLVGDHGKILDDPNDIIGIFRIASLIYAPGRDDIEAGPVNTICGQVDLLPTILHLLGGPFVHESWGRDILALPDNDHGFAFINRDDSYGWIQDSLMLWERVGARSELFDIDKDAIDYLDISMMHPKEASNMKDFGRAMLQLEVNMVHHNKLVASQ